MKIKDFLKNILKEDLSVKIVSSIFYLITKSIEEDFDKKIIFKIDNDNELNDKDKNDIIYHKEENDTIIFIISINKLKETLNNLSSDFSNDVSLGFSLSLFILKYYFRYYLKANFSNELTDKEIEFLYELFVVIFSKKYVNEEQISQKLTNLVGVYDITKTKLKELKTYIDSIEEESYKFLFFFDYYFGNNTPEQKPGIAPDIN